MEETKNQIDEQSFHDLGIVPGLLHRIQEMGFKHPTPIQRKAIPVATLGEDIVGIAQTGSGKTMAFGIPLLQQIAANRKRGLILLPTRELALQVDEELKKLGSGTGIKTAILIGGTNINPQTRQLRQRPHIIIATPGRLIDHMDQKHLTLHDVGMLVLDEADRMLDMGFAPQLKTILARVPKERQTMLFSATMPEKITAIAREHMRKPLRIEVTPPGTTSETVDQEVFIVPREEKLQLLERILGEYNGSVLVFSRTKYAAAKIARKIRDMGHSADEIHSNRSQNQRQRALKGFTNGRFRVLVATDIAARGIDVDHIELVINFDLPDQPDDYVHRIGRTARAGRSGKAISFAAPEQKGDIAHIQKLINSTLPIKAHTGENLAPIHPSTPRSRSASNYRTAQKRQYNRHRR